MTTNLAAARYVARKATSAADARLLLDILGLLDGDRIAADMDPTRAARSVNDPLPKAQVSVVPTQGDVRQRPKFSTAPESLRVLPPIQATPVKRPRSAAQRVGPPQANNQAKAAPCGTETAAKRHKRHGETNPDGTLSCQVCQDGRDQRRHVARPVRKGTMTVGARCGTRYGYDDHLRRDEATCEPCRVAMNAYSRSRYEAHKNRALKPATVHRQCGTPSGRGIHRRRGEECCDPCRVARNEKDRERTA